MLAVDLFNDCFTGLLCVRHHRCLRRLEWVFRSGSNDCRVVTDHFQTVLKETNIPSTSRSKKGREGHFHPKPNITSLIWGANEKQNKNALNICWTFYSLNFNYTLNCSQTISITFGIWIVLKIRTSWVVVVVHTFYRSPWEAETAGSLWASGQVDLQAEFKDSQGYTEKQTLQK